MEYKEIQNLIKLIDSTDLTEFKLKEGEFELLIRTKDYFKFTKSMGKQIASAPVVQTTAPAPVQSSAPAETTAEITSSTETPAPVETPASDDNIVEIKSPIVGTFYRSPSPDKDPYLKIGDHVDVGSIVCIVEAMKLFNEIESEVSGKVVEIVVEDSSPVEYDQVLFKVQKG